MGDQIHLVSKEEIAKLEFCNGKYFYNCEKNGKIKAEGILLARVGISREASYKFKDVGFLPYRWFLLLQTNISNKDNTFIVKQMFLFQIQRKVIYHWVWKMFTTWF